MKGMLTVAVLAATITVWSEDLINCQFNDHRDAAQINFWKSKTSTAELGFDAKEGKTAPGSRTLIFVDEKTSNAICLNPAVKLVPGKTYTAKVWVKAEGLKDDDIITLQIQQRTANGGYVPNLPAIISRDVAEVSECRVWKEMKAEVTVPEGKREWNDVKNLSFVLSAASAKKGMVFVDDFTVTVKK